MNESTNEIIDLASLEGSFQLAKEDFDPEQDAYDTTPIPNGVYQTRVERAEITRSKANDNPMLKWQLCILNGPHAKRRLFRQNMLMSEANFKWLLRDLHTCKVTLERLADLPNILEDLLDTIVEVKVSNGRDAQGRDSQRIYVNRYVGKWTPDPNEAPAGNAPADDDDIPF